MTIGYDRWRTISGPVSHLDVHGSGEFGLFCIDSRSAIEIHSLQSLSSDGLLHSSEQQPPVQILSLSHLPTAALWHPDGSSRIAVSRFGEPSVRGPLTVSIYDVNDARNPLYSIAVPSRKFCDASWPSLAAPFHECILTASGTDGAQLFDLRAPPSPVAYFLPEPSAPPSVASHIASDAQCVSTIPVPPLGSKRATAMGSGGCVIVGTPIHVAIFDVRAGGAIAAAALTADPRVSAQLSPSMFAPLAAQGGSVAHGRCIHCKFAVRPAAAVTASNGAFLRWAGLGRVGIVDAPMGGSDGTAKPAPALWMAATTEAVVGLVAVDAICGAAPPEAAATTATAKRDRARPGDGLETTAATCCACDSTTSVRVSIGAFGPGVQLSERVRVATTAGPRPPIPPSASIGASAAAAAVVSRRAAAPPVGAADAAARGLRPFEGKRTTLRICSRGDPVSRRVPVWAVNARFPEAATTLCGGEAAAVAVDAISDCEAVGGVSDVRADVLGALVTGRHSESSWSSGSEDGVRRRHRGPSRRLADARAQATAAVEAVTCRCAGGTPWPGSVSVITHVPVGMVKGPQGTLVASVVEPARGSVGGAAGVSPAAAAAATNAPTCVVFHTLDGSFAGSVALPCGPPGASGGSIAFSAVDGRATARGVCVGGADVSPGGGGVSVVSRGAQFTVVRETAPLTVEGVDESDWD